MVLRAINSRLPDHWAHRRPWRRLLDLWPQGQIASARLGLWPVGLLPQDRGTHCEPPLFQSANWSALKNKKRRSKYKQLIPMMRLPTSIDLTSYLLRCRAVKASACELEAGTKKHQPCPYIVMFEKRQVLHLGWILFLSPGVNWPSQVSQRDPKNCSPLINFYRFEGS